MNSSQCQQNALDAVKAFAKSDQEQPSPKMVATVNAFFRAIDSNEGLKATENVVAWRTIAAQRLVIDLIRDLSTTELEKAEKALKSIAGTFVTVRWVGGEWKAYVARDGRTAEKVIDEETAINFKQGRLSMDKLAHKFIPNDERIEAFRIGRKR